MSEDADGRGPPAVDPFDDDAPVDLGDLRLADMPILILFWVLAGIVFLQFFTRYVLNDSLGWTEEIARYFLIAVAFTGSILAMRKNSHIAVTFFYRWLPPTGRRGLGLTVDLLKLIFSAAAAWITVKLALRTNQMMASIDLSKAVVYWLVAACFAAMALHAALHLRRHWRRPETIERDLEGGVMD